MNIAKIKKAIAKNAMQLLCVSLLIIIMAVVSYTFISNIVQKHIYRNAEETLNTAEAVISAKTQEAESIVFNLAIALQDKLDHRQPDYEIKRYLDMFSKNMIFSENAPVGFMAVYGYIDGKFIISPEWAPSDDYAPQERPWYKAAEKTPGKVAFTTPYVDLRTGEIVFSASIKLYGAAGEDYGVAAVNIAINDISDYVKMLQSVEGGYGILLNEDLAIIAYYNDSALGKTFKEFITIADSEEHGVHDRMLAGEEHISGIAMKHQNGKVVMSFYRKLYNNWYIGIALPYSQYYHDLYYMAFVLCVLALCAILTLVFSLVTLGIRTMRSEEDSKSKTSFLARMSHEIRTPMNTILGMSELLLLKDASGEIKEYALGINQAGTALLAIINDILDFSKIEAGQLRIIRKNYLLSSLINDTVNIIRTRATEKRLQFVVNVNPNIPAQMLGDEVRLRQILINLLSNAVKYTHEGFVSLDVRMEAIDKKSLKLFFIVKDSGIGIKSEDTEKLFSEFSRVDIEKNQSIEGTGLGLTLAMLLCRAMGGDVSVSSKYGSGSVFTATVVQYFENDQKLAVVNNCAEKNVLVFEERDVYRKSLEREITALCVSVNCVYTKERFLEELATEKYNCVIASPLYALEFLYEISTNKYNVMFVVTTELKHMSAFQNIQSLLIPAYSVTLAGILNGELRNIKVTNKKTQHFNTEMAMVLVVDDISINLRVAKELIEQYGINVHVCNSGKDAIAMIQENQYDIVFMDHMMPDMDGLQTTRAIRKLGEDKKIATLVDGEEFTNEFYSLEKRNQYFRKIPIVALTANVFLNQREMFLSGGMNDFLAKPIEMQKLHDILRKWLPAEKQVEELPEKTSEGKACTEILAINDVDVVLGINRVGGSYHVYRDILAEFCRDARDRISLIKDAVEKEDILLYTTFVHALKSSALNVGATSFSAMAASMEEAGKRNDLSTIHSKTNEMLEQLTILLQNIGYALAQFSQQKDDESQGIRLDALREALLSMDISTVNQILLDYSSLPLSDEVRDIITEIEQYIIAFEYDRAVERIDYFSAQGIKGIDVS